MTRFQRLLVLGCFTGLVAFPFFASHYPAKSGREIHLDEQQKDNESLWAPSTWEPITVLTVALVFVGAVQAGFFLWQLSLIQGGAADAKLAALAARDAAEAAKGTLDANRAWLCSANFNAGEFTNSYIKTKFVARGLRVSLNLTNAGRTPAIKAEVFTTHQMIMPHDEIPVFDHKLISGSSDIRSTSIAPNFIVGGADLPLDETEYNQLVLRERRMIAYLFCSYRDVFNPTTVRTTEICMEIVYGGMGQNSPSGPTFPIFNGTNVGHQNRTD
jgi:hypothetical protein